MTGIGLTNCARLRAELPPFRPVAVQIMKAIGDPNASLAQVSGLLRSDSVLTVELLRVANSALFPSREEIQTAHQAVAFLGLDLVSALVATTAMRALVSCRHSRLTDACWRHSLAAALLCQRWSGIVRLPPERCYTAGMIHDIGQLAFIQVFPEYEHVMQAALDAEDNLLATEAEIYGATHCEAGQWLLSQWGCPLELQNVAAWHENPPAVMSYDRDLVRLVKAASEMANLMKLAAFPIEKPNEVDLITAGFTEPQRQAIAADLADAAEWVAERVNTVEQSLAARV